MYYVNISPNTIKTTVNYVNISPNTRKTTMNYVNISRDTRKTTMPNVLWHYLYYSPTEAHTSIKRTTLLLLFLSHFFHQIIKANIYKLSFCNITLRSMCESWAIDTISWAIDTISWAIDTIFFYFRVRHSRCVAYNYGM